jgi:ribosomal protein S18 acetylase RimI-like enzyme
MPEANGLVLRGARDEDAERLAVLHVEVWEQAYTGLMPDQVFADRRATLPQRTERWRTIIADSPAPTTVAVLDGRIVGFGSAGPPREERPPAPEELWSLYVHADCWGRGVGHALMTELVADRPAFLWVLDGNERAIGFYRRHGFAEDGEVKRDDIGTELRMVRV